MNATLYVSHSKRGLFYYNDASARYRCVFPAEECISLGQQAHTIHFNQIHNIDLSQYTKIIFHRPQYSFKLWRTIQTLKKYNIEHRVDFDDLLFCPELSNTSAAVQSGKMSESLAKKNAQAYLKALNLFTHVQVSTHALAQQLKTRVRKKLNIEIHHNKIPERWVKQAEVIPAQERLQKKIIRYLPGTSHHKHDFAHVEKFLAQLLQENPSYQLNIIGDLEFDTTLFPTKQISQTPFQPYEQLPSLINDSWIIIAPLVDNVFNRCKSGLKFWESAAFGIPVISSPLPDIERFKNTGLCISDNINTWRKYIHSMENLDTYQQANEETKEASKITVFSQPPEEHRFIYLKLTSEFGPRWPSKRLDPTFAEHHHIIRQHLSLVSQSNIDKHSLTKNILESAKIKIANDTPPASNKALRKARKLVRSPKEFFKDFKNNKKSNL